MEGRRGCGPSSTDILPSKSIAFGNIPLLFVCIQGVHMHVY